MQTEIRKLQLLAAVSTERVDGVQRELEVARARAQRMSEMEKDLDSVEERADKAVRRIRVRS